MGFPTHDLRYYSDEGSVKLPTSGIFHGVPLTTGKVWVVRSHWVCTTQALHNGINSGAFVAGADYTVLAEVEHDFATLVVASFRVALTDGYVWARQVMAEVNRLRPGWASDGMYDVETGGVWIKLSGSKRFYDWEGKGMFSSTVALFHSADEFVHCQLDPRAVDVSDTVEVNVKALCKGLNLAPSVRPRYTRKAAQPGNQMALVQPQAEPTLVEAHYPMLEEPGAETYAIVQHQAVEQDLPRTYVVEDKPAPEPVAEVPLVEDPQDSATWQLPENVRNMMLEGEARREREAMARAQSGIIEPTVPMAQEHPLLANKPPVLPNFWQVDKG